MSGGDAPRPAPERARSSWRETLTDPTVVAVALYAAVALCLAVAAYFTLFTQFAGYDDEGTLLVTLKAFANGHVLYRDVYSEYGPFYYELFGGLFALSGHAVTTDASRSIVAVVWVATSLMFGITAQRLSGRLLLGVTGMIAAFATLTVLSGEPMHPQGLCVLLIAAFALLAVGDPGRRGAWLGGLCGALLAALVLTKVNLGAFAVAATVLAAVLTIEPLHRRRWLRWPVIAAFLAMPFFVFARDLDTAWVRELLLIEVFAMAALIVGARILRPDPGEGDGGMIRWLAFAALGFAVAFVAIVVAILLTGPSLADVYGGVVTEALRVRDVLVTQLIFPTVVVDWGLAAVALAVVVVKLRGRAPAVPSLWEGLFRALVGLTIWFTIARLAPLAFNPSGGNGITLPMVLAWVAAVPPAGAEEGPHKRFLRVLLPAIAIAETLQVYPVAGSQIGIAAVTFVPVGAICLADALASLRAWSEARGESATWRLGVVSMVVVAALAVEFGLDAIARPAVTNAITYHRQQALPFPGATAMRLPPEEAEKYARLVELTRLYRCTGLIGYPNIDSLYLWSGIEAPPPSAPGAWILALDDERQQRIVDELRSTPRPCAIKDQQLADAWLHGAPPPESPLVEYILDEFEPVAEAGEIQFMVPKR